MKALPQWWLLHCVKVELAKTLMLGDVSTKFSPESGNSMIYHAINKALEFFTRAKKIINFVSNQNKKLFNRKCLSCLFYDESIDFINN